MRRVVTYWLCLGLGVALTQLVAAAPSPPKAAEPFVDLAGDYYEGVTRYGTVITLGSTGWFRFTTQRDNLAVPNKKCKGMFWEWQGTLIFKPAETIKIDEEWEAPPRRLVPVRWGKRRYLIREERAQDFCNSVNLGDEPRSFWGVPYLRGKDFQLRVQGTPEVPERWRRFLLSAPVTCAVTELLPDARYRIDAGAQAGLLVGMIVSAGSWERNFAVESVEPGSAIVKMSDYGTRKPLSVGQRLSTLYAK